MITKAKAGKVKHWIFLDEPDYVRVRVLAEEMGLSFSAYVRALIKKDIKEKGGN
jgi:hypothetical protein